MSRTVEDRFWEKVDASGDCWEWIAGLSTNGYGNFYDGKRYVIASRWAYAYFYGEIPEGLCVLHRCDNPKCVNPTHLFLGTQADNMADMVAKGRSRPLVPARRKLRSDKNRPPELWETDPEAWRRHVLANKLS
jgi:hypothetical protein